MTEGWFERTVEVVCNNETVHERGQHVAWLFPDAPAFVNTDALLVGNDPLSTVRAGLERQAMGSHVRGWFRFECPVCGTRGATPEARAQVLRPVIDRAATLGVSSLDIYSLERYLSD